MKKGDRIVMRATAAGPKGCHLRDRQYVVGREIEADLAKAYVKVGAAAPAAPGGSAATGPSEDATAGPEETAMREPPEDATTGPEETADNAASGDRPAIEERGGGWFEVAGQKVQGYAAAEALADKLAGG